MARIREQRSLTRANGVFRGTFGSLYGLAVRIRCPTTKEVLDPGNYYCRKGFYALNVQAICDKAKRVLWCFPSNKGSTHDSSAFKNSRLFALLRDLSCELQHRGLFIAGDSAYGLTLILHLMFLRMVVVSLSINANLWRSTGPFFPFDTTFFPSSCTANAISSGLGYKSNTSFHLLLVAAMVVFVVSSIIYVVACTWS